MLRMNQETDRITLNFKIIWMVFTLIFVMGGAVHLCGSDSDEGCAASMKMSDSSLDNVGKT
jgi:hypothetical protein